MSCPSCGSPVPLALVDRDWSCTACDSGGTLPDAVQARLDAAAEVLRAHDASERQLRGAARGAVTRSGMAQTLFLVFVAFLATPLLFVGLLTTLRLFGTQGAEFALACGELSGLLPLGLLMALEVVFASWLFRRARRRVAMAAAAVPPHREGGVAGCHVCGGPLSAGVQGVARCDYCGADNVVDADIVAAAASARKVELEDYATAVVAESGSVSRAFGCSTVLFLGVVFIAPFTCTVPMWTLVFSGWAMGMVLWLMAMGGQPPTPGNRFGLVDTDGRECIAWYNPYTERWERARVKREQIQDIEVSGVREVALEDLLGRELVVVLENEDDKRAGVRGTAEQPHWGYYLARDGRTLDGPDTVRLRQPGEKRARTTVRLWATCIAE
jgi:hypothetical protein